MFFKMAKGLSAPPERVRTACSRVQTDAIHASGGTPAADIASPFYLYFQTEDGPMFDPYRIPGSRSLHEQKMATWALLIGETHSSAVHAETRRRPHRGMLPDVDFSRAIPDRRRPSLVRRIIGLMGSGAKGRAGEAVPSGSSNEPVGEKAGTPYIAPSRTGGPGDSRPPVFNDTRSRAA
jgi:hypothetical protein